MDCHIVYLHPVGAGGYKAELRSDTLWAALCWAIRSLFGDEELAHVLASYSHPDASDAFFISSAFPWREEDGEKICFFPAPLMPFRQSEEIGNVEELTPSQIKQEMRRRKHVEKRLNYLSQSHFEYQIGSRREPPSTQKAPTFINRPMTHNTIDRLKGSTLDLNDSGQLFHTNEIYLEGKSSGLFFLLRGNLEKVIPALRYLEHEGIGGDRSTGKGRFKIEEPVPFTLNTPSDANAWMCLSLYHPQRDEFALWDINNRLLNYRIEERIGRTHLQKNYLHNRPLVFFKEGSAFPKHGNNKSAYGQNVITGTHSAGFDMYRYGFGFMVEAKIQ